MKSIDVAKAIALDYFSENNSFISPIKLQKVLYFLFAFYGSYVRDISSANDVEIDTNDLSEHLFEPKFLAWRYGPVDRSVYDAYKNITGIEENKVWMGTQSFCDLFPDNLIANEVFKSLTRQAFNLSDFSLVDISHKDQAWINAYPTPFQEMDSEEIISEYAERRAAKVERPSQ